MLEDSLYLMLCLLYSPGEGKGYPLQYSGLENSMDCSPWGLEESDTTEQVSLHFTHSLYSYSTQDRRIYRSKA